MHRLKMWTFLSLVWLSWTLTGKVTAADSMEIREDAGEIRIETPHLAAVIRKRGYVSGVAGRSFLDKKTGFRDVGFGLDIADWLMEPGDDAAYRDKLPETLVYQYNSLVHGHRAKRSIEGPQICTKARQVEPEIIRGDDFVAVRMSYRYHIAAPGKKTGSLWTQTLVFPESKRYFISSDRIDTVNGSDGLFLRIDMPGHIKHRRGDTFSHIYLSYHDRTNTPSAFTNGMLSPEAFLDDFPPDEKFHYLRERVATPPDRFIRAYRLRDTRNGNTGPWLAGMTLDPSVVYEAWCHQRGYVCMIEEFGGRPIRAGESFSAAFIVGFFDSIAEMHATYDAFKGHNGLQVDETGWKLTK
ncbi:MAG: hypothetical protein ACC628_17330 [Pirellulaceae bacterium]